MPTWPRNGNLGRFTNFVNLLDMCGIAVPSGMLQGTCLPQMIVYLHAMYRTLYACNTSTNCTFPKIMYTNLEINRLFGD